MSKKSDREAQRQLLYKHRDYARAAATQGIAYLAHAFNHSLNPDTPYRYSPEVQERFQTLAIEIVGLIERGELAPYTPQDAEFLRFMSKAMCGKNLPESSKQ